MNLRRGFKRITLFLAIIAAVFCGYISFGIVLEELEMGWFWGVLAGLGGIAFGYCSIWLVYELIEWFVLGFCGIQSRSKEKNNVINLRRGFKRVTFVLAVIAATFCAGLLASIVINEHQSAQSYLQWRRENPRLVLDEPFTLDQMASTPKAKWEEILEAAATNIKAEKPTAEAQLKELENGFWVSLSKGSLVGLCMLAGLAGAVAGFGGVWLGYCVIWLVYKLLKWVVYGFCHSPQ